MATFAQLIAKGTIRDETKVWTEGLDEWTVYSELKDEIDAACDTAGVTGE